MHDLIKRIRRMYTAIDETAEADLTKLSAKVVSTDKAFAICQDFSAGISKEQAENDLQSIIAIVASFEYHLRRWADQNGHDPNQVTETAKESRPLQIVHDLWNNEKHGFPGQAGRDRSGEAPRLENVSRIMRLRTQAKKGSFVTMTFGPGGTPVKHGDGSALAVVTGDILDRGDKKIGDAYDTIVDAIGTWEALLKELGFSVGTL